MNVIESSSNWFLKPPRKISQLHHFQRDSRALPRRPASQSNSAYLNLDIYSNIIQSSVELCADEKCFTNSLNLNTSKPEQCRKCDLLACCWFGLVRATPLSGALKTRPTLRFPWTNWTSSFAFLCSLLFFLKHKTRERLAVPHHRK